MKSKRFGHPRFADYRIIGENPNFTPDPRLGWIYIGLGFTQSLVSGAGDALSLFGPFTDREKIAHAIAIVRNELDGWVEQALAMVEPMEPTDREWRQGLRLYTVYVDELGSSQFKFSLSFQFNGKEEWYGNPAVDVSQEGGRVSLSVYGLGNVVLICRKCD